MSTPLINKAAVKKMALQLSKDTRAGKFTRVSTQFLDRVNASVSAMIRSEVHRHPGIGKTIM